MRLLIVSSLIHKECIAMDVQEKPRYSQYDNIIVVLVIILVGLVCACLGYRMGAF